MDFPEDMPPEVEAQIKEALTKIDDLRDQIFQLCDGQDVGHVFSAVLSIMVLLINDEEVDVEVRQGMVNALEVAYNEDLIAEYDPEFDGPAH